eukprot:TRINITY_DN1640_c0_g1_i1.p1 TRINITY_DN1640_c0_g1~~TRINITY_DN1640_c0_g1_i1.p1  ORF type:complete len:596 (-),score=275.60 TRINITY_DN1640_c0_g1_i1:122-1909(-)
MFKAPQIGTVSVRLEEVRGLKDINYIVLNHDDQTFSSKQISPKKVEDQKWDESHTFNVHSLQSHVEVIVVKKRVLQKDKFVANAKIPIPGLQDQEPKHEWFPLLKYMTPKKMAKDIKQEVPQLGEVRLEVKYTSLKQKVEKTYKGEVIESEWNDETSGGTIINHGTWMNNNQFLLTVKNEDTLVNIKVFQPEESEEKNSFYLLKYDPYWDGHKKVVCHNDDIIKIDQFLTPLFGEEAEAKWELRKGKYVIVPCTENPDYRGKFSVNVWTATNDDFTLESLPLSGKTWNKRTAKGEWNKNTAGGGVITGLNWRKNPQYLLQVEGDEDADACVVLSQPEKDMSIGFYIIRYTGFGRKEIEYKNEVGKTDSFKSSPSVGMFDMNLKAGNKYCIIPCTSEPSNGEFTLSVYSDRNIQLNEIDKKWENVATRRSAWRGQTAGGSPNEATFTDNPQFLLTFPKGKRSEFVVDLTVGDDSEAVGFLVVQRDNEKEKKRLGKGKISNDNTYLKPEGWLAQISVSAYGTVTESSALNTYFVIVPSTFRPEVEKSFRITVYSDEEIKLDKLGEDGIIEGEDDPETSDEEEDDDEEEEEEEEEDEE